MFDEVTAVVNVRTGQFELGMFELVCNRSCIDEQRISLAHRRARDTSITAELPSRQHAINSLQILRLLRIPGQTAPHAMTSTTQCSHFPFSVERIERVPNWRTIDDRREVAISQLALSGSDKPADFRHRIEPTHAFVEEIGSLESVAQVFTTESGLTNHCVGALCDAAIRAKGIE